MFGDHDDGVRWSAEGSSCQGEMLHLQWTSRRVLITQVDQMGSADIKCLVHTYQLAQVTLPVNQIRRFRRDGNTYVYHWDPMRRPQPKWTLQNKLR